MIDEFDEQEDTSSNEMVQTPSPAAKTSPFPYTRNIIIGAVTIILLCAAAFGFFKLIQNLDYMRPVKDICSIYNNRETDAQSLFKAIYSGPDKKAYKSAYKMIATSDLYYEYIDSLPQQLEDYYRINAAEGGSNIKMKFDTTGDKVKMDESQLAIIYNELKAASEYYQGIIDDIDNMGKDDWQRVANEMGLSLKRTRSLGSAIRSRCEQYVKFDIKGGYYLTGRFVLYNKSGDTVDKTDKLTLAIIKLNGSWYIYEGRSEGVLLATGSSFLSDNDILWDIYTNYIK